MKVAPGARPDDGRLWVTIIEPKPKITMMLKVLPRVVSGDHINEDGFHFFATDSIHVKSDVRMVIDTDGEAEWGTGAKLEILPGAVRVMAVIPEEGKRGEVVTSNK